MIAGIFDAEIKHLNEWATGLPVLPPDWKYRFESDMVDFSDDDNVVLTMRAIPEQIHYFEEE